MPLPTPGRGEVLRKRNGKRVQMHKDLRRASPSSSESQSKWEKERRAAQNQRDQGSRERSKLQLRAEGWVGLAAGVEHQQTS